MSLVCSKCSTGTQFKAILKRPAVIELSGDEPVIVQEGKKFQYEVVGCMSCNEKISNEDLAEMLACSECQAQVLSTELEEGVCTSCVAAKQRPDLMGLSPEQMIRKILELEKALNTKGDRIEKKIEDAGKTIEEAVEKRAAKAEEDTNATTTTGKGNGKNSRKKKIEETPEESTEAPAEVGSPVANEEATVEAQPVAEEVGNPIDAVIAPPVLNDDSIF